MIPFFPRQIATKAVSIYLISLALVSVIFFRFSMPLWRMGLGLAFVAGFFMLTATWSKKWTRMPDGQFTLQIFVFSFVLRFFWVLASYFYYMNVNGVPPFEFEAADSVGYHEVAEWLSSESWDVAWAFFFGPYTTGVSDVGYPLYLTLLYKLFGPFVLVPRFIKCLLGAWTCVMIYRLTSRTFSDPVGRMAGIMCCLMPNFIIYCGYHLKEVEMLFLEVAFLERLDYLLRVRRYNLWNILLPILLAASLFFFRTVLGAMAIFAATTAVVFTDTPMMKKGGRRLLIAGWGALAIIVGAGTVITTEAEMYWEQRDENVARKREQQTAKGNQWAQYATGTVMAPMIVALPFSTMVVTEGQENQITKHGGNYVRNFMAFFALLAIFEAFRQKKWRDFTLIGAFTLGYLFVIALTGYSNAERFLLPGLPGLIIMWAYGISELRWESYRLLRPWCFVVILMEISWAFFKLGSRGLF